MEYNTNDRRYVARNFSRVLWYDPETGEIVNSKQLRTLPEDKRKRMVRAGRYYLDKPLLVVKCPVHGVWHPATRRHAIFYLWAVERAKDCQEYERACELFTLSRSLAELYIKRCDKQEVLKAVARWAIRHLTSEKFHKSPFIAEVFPYASAEILQLYEELELKRLAKLLKR